MLNFSFNSFNAERITRPCFVARNFISLSSTDLAIKMCMFYAEPRISRVAISSGRARAISRNLVHSLKAKSVHKFEFWKPES